MTQKRILIGQLLSAHGVRGLMKLKFFGDDISLLKDTDLFTGETGDKTLRLTLKNQMKNLWLVAVDGVPDKTMADTLRHTKLYVPRTDLPELDSDEIYHIDLVGYKAQNTSKDPIGTVKAVTNFGASDLIEITPKGGESFFIPYTDEYVPNIDKKSKTITIQEIEYL